MKREMARVRIASDLTPEEPSHAAADVVMADDLVGGSTLDELVSIVERRRFVDAQRAVVFFLHPDVHAVRPAVIRSLECVHENMMAQAVDGKKGTKYPALRSGKVRGSVDPAVGWKNGVAKCAPGASSPYRRLNGASG